MLPIVQPHFAQGVALFLLFLAVVLLNVLADRFWCRYLCPLGALLGLLAKVQLLRPVVGDGCSDCGACAAACRLDAIEVGGRGASRAAAKGAGTSPPAQLVTSECTMCLDCLVGLPARGRRLAGRAPGPGPGRSTTPAAAKWSIAAAAGVGAALLFGTGVGARRRAPGLIRPPGAAGRGRLPLPLPALQRVHEGLPDLRPAAHAR